MKEAKFPNSWKPSHWWVCGEFGISEGNITGREGKKTNHKIGAYHNSQWRTIPDACLWHQQAGTGQGGAGYILRVRTGPERPEDNLRELT